VAPLPDSYDTVIGGVVVIGLPLIVGVLLQKTPGLVALGACGAAIAVMALVARTDGLPVVGPVPGVDAATTSPQVLSSLALAVGAWSAGRVLRRGGLVAWTGTWAPARTAPVPYEPLRPYPDAGELIERAGLLGLRPTTIRVDRLHDDRLSQQLGAVVREVLDEALDNAARHAPGAELMIKVLRQASVISIEVVNGRSDDQPGETAGSGRGIPELAERIARVGGMFGVGPASGGFALRARLPITACPVHVDDHRIEVDASPVKVPAAVEIV